jgi:hypothetical protein
MFLTVVAEKSSVLENGDLYPTVSFDPGFLFVGLAENISWGLAPPFLWL